MNGSSVIKKSKHPQMQNPKGSLEKRYIEEYLLSKGYHRKDLENLPEEEAKQLMVEASTYASLKLADIEARSHFRNKIHWPS